MNEHVCKPVADAHDPQSHFEDEALEACWEQREAFGQIRYEALFTEVGHKQRLDRMEEKGLIAVDGGLVTLSAGGEARARDIIRRHRLAERLFADVLDLKEYELDACRLEHALSPGVEEAICTMLGHPPHCPHGKPIPKGECCAVYTSKVTPLAQSLINVPVGSRARIVFINIPSMGRLATMGLVPGASLRLQQKRPAYVIEVDETTVAIDEELARGIFVKTG